VNLSIVFSTFKSEDILEKSLQAYCKIETDYQWELIIIDNACRPETRGVIKRYQKNLPIVFLEQPIPGKNNAINLALPLIKSDLVFFTDNDIIPAIDIIDVYVNAAKKYPEYHVLSGRILSDRHLPAWIDTNDKSIQAALGLLNLGDDDAEVDLISKVWGGNMLIRRSIFDDGFTFNNKIGPNGKNYIMGSESELLQRLKEQGYRAKYIAASIVKHQIRDEQISIIWLALRSYRAGKGQGYIGHDTQVISRFFGYSRYLIRVLLTDVVSVISKFDKSSRCKAIMKLYNTAGQLRQSKQ
jgi:glycosyltransferase involved in cell wall biosynthesis